MLCPDCGTEVEELVEGACPRCFTKRHDLAQVAKHIDVLLCTTCGARRDGQIWVDAAGRDQQAMLDEAVVAEVQAHVAVADASVELVAEPQDERNIHYDIMVDGEVGGLSLDTLLETVVRIKPTVCTTCSRQAGGYFSAIIQIRASDRELAADERDEAERVIVREIDRMVKAGNQNAFVTDDIEVKGGKDYQISEIEVGRIIAKKLASRFDADTKESPKLVGRKEGRDVYRVTYLVRIPPYRRGDFVNHRDRLHRVERIEKRTVALKDLLSHKATTVPRDQVGPQHMAARKRDTKEFMVVSVVRDEALMMDPDTSVTYEVVLPESLDYDLSIRTLDCIVHEEQAYFVGLPTERGRLRVI